MAAAAIFSHSMSAAQALANTGASPMATSAAGTSDSSSTSSSSSATISANDFLTLLVTEMQNQDPTANTDPNEYINQLVNVNSLEQLIDINQNLSTALGDSSSAAASAGSTQPAVVPSATSGANLSGPISAGTTLSARVHSPLSVGGGANDLSALSTATKHLTGNLSVPAPTAAAHQVAQALDGRSHERPVFSDRSAVR